MEKTVLYYATYNWCGLQLIKSDIGDILYVKAENKEDAKEKIFNYIRKHYSVNSIGYAIMENPNRYSFAIMTKEV